MVTRMCHRMTSEPSSQGPKMRHLLARLSGVRPAPCGAFVAICPAHDDHHASLSIGEGHDGRLLLHCWAGCGTSDVLTALGLDWSDLFTQAGDRRGRRQQRRRP